MTTGRAHRWLAMAIGAWLAAACGTTPPPPAAESEPAPPALDRARWRHASLLLRARDVSDDEWQRWTTEHTPAAAIADDMLGDRFFTDQVAPGLLFRNNLLRHARMIGGGFLLKTADIGGETVHYIKEPCRASDVVTVAPWWDLDHPLRVCKQSVAADVWDAVAADGRRIACSSMLVGIKTNPKSPCRCGPNLLRCSPPGLVEAIGDSAVAEMGATAAHVVRADLPIERLFTMNETWHDRTMELFYLRARAEALRMDDPEPLFRRADGWPAEGKLAPRDELEPGQHAGILSAPQIVNHVFDARQRQRVVYEVLWCAGESAPGALPEDLLSLHTANLSTVNEGWRELAARPICTSCHARLDYGMQFFRGHSTANIGPWHYVAGGAGSQGPLYGDNIGDPRGSAPLTVGGFASLATRQPEFTRCMVRDAAEYVFGPSIPSDVIERLVEASDPATMRFRDLVRGAVLELMRCDTCALPGLAPAAAAAPAATGPTLAGLVDQHCSACHFPGADIPSFEGSLDRSSRARIANQVLSGRMPPAGALSAPERASFWRAARLTSPRSATSALDRDALLLGQSDPPAALPLVVARAYIAHLAGRTEAPAAVDTVETALAGRDNLFTPNYAALTAVDAYESCAGGATAAARATCVGQLLAAVWWAVPPRPVRP